jgi:hypothetical protein
MVAVNGQKVIISSAAISPTGRRPCPTSCLCLLRPLQRLYEGTILVQWDRSSPARPAAGRRSVCASRPAIILLQEMAWRFARAAWSPVAFLSSVDHSPSLCGIVRRSRNGWMSPQGQLRFIATSLAAERTMVLMFLRVQFHLALAAPGAIVRAFYPHRGVRPCLCPSRRVDAASDTHRRRGEKRTGRESFTAETVHLSKGRTSLVRTYFVHLRGATFN